MAKKILHLICPQKLIKRPVIYTIAKKFNVIPNIRRAKVTEKAGEVTLELNGSKENLEKSNKYLRRQGVEVKPVIGDIIE